MRAQEPDVSKQIAADLFSKMLGVQSCAVTAGRGAGLQQGLTAWWSSDNWQSVKMSHVLLPVGMRAEDIKDSVQKEIDALIAASVCSPSSARS
jgi:hypothetical protein